MRSSSSVKWMALLSAVAVALSPFATGAQTPAPVKLRYLSFNGFVHAHELAKELGYFDGKGIELESKGYVTGGPEMLMAQAAGDIELSIVATSAMLNAIGGGNDLVATYPTTGIDGSVQSRFYVLDDSPIKDIKDLAGKTIAVNTLGAHLDFVVREAVRKAGLPPRSVKLITVPNPQLEQVLRSTQADIVAIGNWATNFQGAIEKNGGTRVLFKDTDVLGELSGGFAVVRRQFATANSEATRQFSLQSARALDFARENLDEARKHVAKVLARRGENPELAQYFRGYGVRKGGVGTLHDVQFWIELMEREKLLQVGKIDAGKIMFMTSNASSTGK